MNTASQPSALPTNAGFSRIRVYSSAEARQQAERQLRAVGFSYFTSFKDVSGFGLSYGHAPREWPDTCPWGQRWTKPGQISMVEAAERAARA